MWALLEFVSECLGTELRLYAQVALDVSGIDLGRQAEGVHQELAQCR